MNITHEHPEYQALRNKAKHKNHGCWYYSNEIVDNIIPRVKTWREWNTVGRDLEGMHDSMIVFLHDNSTPWNYQWLHKYKDLILVCSSEYTANSVKFSGKTVFLPMSVDTEYVKQFKTRKTRDLCFAGNPWVLENCNDQLEDDIDYLINMPREKMLKELAKYRRAYAIDRVAIEAKVLGCNLEKISTRYSVDNVGNVLDNREAAKILQRELDKIDGGKK